MTERGRRHHGGGGLYLSVLLPYSGAAFDICMPVLYCVGIGDKKHVDTWRETKHAILDASNTIMELAYARPLTDGRAVCLCVRGLLVARWCGCLCMFEYVCMYVSIWVKFMCMCNDLIAISRLCNELHSNLALVLSAVIHIPQCHPYACNLHPSPLCLQFIYFPLMLAICLQFIYFPLTLAIDILPPYACNLYTSPLYFQSIYFTFMLAICILPPYACNLYSSPP